MSEEEFFNRMINQISKVFDGRIATKMKNIYLKKDKQLNKQKEVLDKIKDKCLENMYIDDRGEEVESIERDIKPSEILELLEEIE